MRNLESETFNELASVSIRWLILLGLGVLALPDSGGRPATAAVLLGMAAWNTVLTILAYTGRPFDLRGTLRVAIDLLAANLLFYYQSKGSDIFIWAGLLPVASAGMFFELRGTLLAVLASFVSLGVQALLLPRPEAQLASIVWMALALVAAGLIFLYIRQFLLSQHEKNRRDLLKAKQEDDRAAEERTQTLINAGESFSKDLDAERIVRTALSLSANFLSLSPEPENQPVGALFLISKSDPGTFCLEAASTWRFPPADEPTRFTTTGGLITRSIEEGKPRLSKEISKDPELYRFPALRSCQVVYCIPLAGGSDPEPIGALLLAHPAQETFTRERREVLDAIGKMAGHAIRNAHHYRDLGRERERLIQILQVNRGRLVRELHDGSTQSVSALALRANLIRRTYERDGKTSVEELHKLEDLARITAKEIRQMLFTLRPLEAKAEELGVSLENLADNLRKTSGKNIVIAADPEVVSRLAPVTQSVIFYVVEEALDVAHRNGNTEPVLVRVREEEGELACLQVEYPGNPGNAVDAASYESKNSLSVSNMQERAALVNGHLEIETSEDEGIKIRLLVPITAGAAERLRGRL
jgi:signal transduction histidine kinase